ncbi:hypothetical protein M422DRAFT_239354 [Sphaerobolus stellatus SS14]|nr:hypothetical protein M422DRAFT_239354 [Sphaerobolus stellatus SS14]
MTSLVEAAFPILNMTHLADISLLAPNICTLSLGIFMKGSAVMLSAQFKRLHTLIVSALYEDMLYNALQQLHIPAVQHVTLLFWWSGDIQENVQVSWPNLETFRLDSMVTTKESSEYVRRFFLNVPTLRILHLTGCEIPQFYSAFLSGSLKEPVLCPQLLMLVLQSCVEPGTEGLEEFIQDRMILRNSQGTDVPLRVGLDQESYSSILWLGSPIFKEPYIKEITTEWISPFPERETRFHTPPTNARSPSRAPTAWRGTGGTSMRLMTESAEQDVGDVVAEAVGVVIPLSLACHFFSLVDLNVFLDPASLSISDQHSDSTRHGTPTGLIACIATYRSQVWLYPTLSTRPLGVAFAFTSIYVFPYEWNACLIIWIISHYRMDLDGLHCKTAGTLWTWCRVITLHLQS